MHSETAKTILKSAAKLTPPFAEPLEHELNGKATNEIVLLKKLKRLEWWLGKLGFIKISLETSRCICRARHRGAINVQPRGEKHYSSTTSTVLMLHATWVSSIFSPPNRYSCCGAEFRSIFFFVSLARHTAERFSSTKRSREKQQPNNLVIEHNCRYILSAAEESRKVSDVASAVFEKLLCCSLSTASLISSQ